MIIVSIIGGLGNQMFQYAAARALADRTGQSLTLDISGFASYKLHNGFQLKSVFSINVPVASRDEVSQMLGWRSINTIQRVLRRSVFSLLRGESLVFEPHFHYWPEFQQVNYDCYLQGYWQSEKYFKAIEETIRSEFVFSQPMTSQNKKLAERIGRTNSVSLHIRRGDYVQNKKNASIYAICSLDYYQRAISHIAAIVENPCFYIFSDDIEWVRHVLKLEFDHEFVDINHDENSYNDMRLMSLCKHNIIANSSFSWWGAWLNPNVDKTVIAPKKWFVNDMEISDLIPNSWITL